MLAGSIGNFSGTVSSILFLMCNRFSVLQPGSIELYLEPTDIGDVDSNSKRVRHVEWFGATSYSGGVAPVDLVV